MKTKIDTAKWIAITLGLIAGITLFVAIPMYANYQANGCVFIICN